MKIAFLHTAAAHVETFDTLLEGRADVQLIHEVQPAWLAQAVRSGITRELSEVVSQSLTALADRADVVICTCSSLGPIAQLMADPKVFRVDEPMMSAAVEHAPVLLVVCLESTMAASSELLEQAFSRADRAPRYTTLLCGEVWRHFEEGDTAAFGRQIAAQVVDELRSNEEHGCVVLAQASMRAAVEYLANCGVPVYSSIELALVRALANGSGDRL